MGTRLVPQAAVLAGAFFALLAVGLGAAAAAAPVVVGSVKCLDCSPLDVNAEDALKGLKVAVKCKSGADGTYETKALAPLDDTGAFSIPLSAELLRDNGELDGDCFAQLHDAPDTPCVGQAAPRITPAGLGQDGNTTTTSIGGVTYLAAAADTVFGPVACACGKLKKKHFMFGPPPPPPPKPAAPKPPTPTPTYGPPKPTPAPVPKPPAPPVEEPEPFFHKHPKFMHKKKPCPPLVVDDDTTLTETGGQDRIPKKLD